MNCWRGVNQYISELVARELERRNLRVERVANDLDVPPAYLADWLSPDTLSVVGSYGVDLLQHLNISPFQSNDPKYMDQLDTYLQKVWPESLLGFLEIERGEPVRMYVANVLKKRFSEKFVREYAQSLSSLGGCDLTDTFYPFSVELWEQMTRGDFSGVRNSGLFRQLASANWARGMLESDWMPIRDATPAELFELDRRLDYKGDRSFRPTQVLSTQGEGIGGVRNSGKTFGPDMYWLNIWVPIRSKAIDHLLYFMHDESPP